MTAKHTPGKWLLCASEEANASLIAAAPELLDALRLMIGYRGHGKTVDERVAIARAAIAKAEGK